MEQDSAFCIAYSRLQADHMVHKLKEGAFQSRSISVLSATGPMVSALGDIVRGLHDQGVPWVMVRLYEGRIKGGRILVAVQADCAAAITRAMEIFSQIGGADVCATCDYEQSEFRSQSQDPARSLHFA